MDKDAGTGKELELDQLLVERRKKKGSASEYMKGQERFLKVAEGIVKVAVPGRFKKKGWKWKLGTSLCWLTWV